MSASHRAVVPVSRRRLVWQVFKAHYRRARRYFGPVRSVRCAWLIARAFSRSLDRREGEEMAKKSKGKKGGKPAGGMKGGRGGGMKGAC
jgi:hypothetical protein